MYVTYLPKKQNGFTIFPVRCYNILHILMYRFGDGLEVRPRLRRLYRFSGNCCVLYVELDNGSKGYFDLSPYLDKGIFVRLKDVDYLKAVRPNSCGIYWPRGQDFSADTIEHEMQKEIRDAG